MNELLKEALEALEEAVGTIEGLDGRDNSCDEKLDLGDFRKTIAKLTAALSSVEAKPVAMTNERIDNIAGLVIKGMPDGLQGFMNVWGWQQFARALLECASVPDSIAAPLASVEAQSRLSEAEDELNCAEEVLDSFAAGLDMEETGFDCVGDYITAVVEATKAQIKPQCPQPQAEPSPEVERDARRYRWASEHGILTVPGWPIAPCFKAEWDSRIDAALSGGSQ